MAGFSQPQPRLSLEPIDVVHVEPYNHVGDSLVSVANRRAFGIRQSFHEE
jgi:hypothetical protein